MIDAFKQSPLPFAGADGNCDNPAAGASASDPTPDASTASALMLWGQLRLAAGVCQVQVSLHPNTSGWELVVQHKGRERAFDLEDNIRKAANQLVAEVAKDVHVPVEERAFYKDARRNWMSLGQSKGQWRVFIRCAWDGHTDSFDVSTVDRAPDYATAAEALQRYAKLKRWRRFTHQQYLEDINDES